MYIQDGMGHSEILWNLRKRFANPLWEAQTDASSHDEGELFFLLHGGLANRVRSLSLRTRLTLDRIGNELFLVV